MDHPQRTLIRNPLVTRVNHWLTAFFFVALVLSGLSMFHPGLYFLSALFGGGQWTRAIHPWFGIGLVISFFFMVLQFWRDNRWTRSDLEWLRKTNRVMMKEEEGVPECERFNAGQKGVFWAMVVILPVLLVTGLIAWEYYFGFATPIPVQRLALLIHSGFAILAIVIWIVHVHAAIWVKGSMQAMLYGGVTPGWAWRHHRKWLRRLSGARSGIPQGPAE